VPSKTDWKFEKHSNMFKDYHHHPHLQRHNAFKHPICRFLIQGLSSSNGRSKSDFHVDLVLSVDGLLTLVKSVYGVLNTQFRSHETHRGFHWRLHFQGEVYRFSDPDIHHFDLLRQPLRSGQTGWFEGSTASFRFSIVNTHMGEICSTRLVQYPKISVVVPPRELTPEMKADWLSDEMKLRAKDFNFRCKKYNMNGANIWNQDAAGDYFRDTPKPTKWTKFEEDILSLVVRSGHKFQESWNNILQYCLLSRSEVETSQQWYKQRKRLSLDVSDSDDDSKGGFILEAKRLGSILQQAHLKAGVPEHREHPLRKRNHVLGEASKSNSFPPAKRRRVSFQGETCGGMQEQSGEIGGPIME
jgi:hypothetical protein